MDRGRFEYKIVVNQSGLSWVRSLILTHSRAFYARYPERRVNNIYFDTKDFDCLRANINGSALRQKVRFRWYGEGTDDIYGNLELKFKNNNLGWKVIEKVSVPLQLGSMDWSSIVKLLRGNLSGLVRLRFDRACFPAIINRYYREYYETRDGLFRITLDHSQAVYDQRIYRRPNLSFAIPRSEKAVIELKFSKAALGSIGTVMDELPFYVTQNSKYASALTGQADI